ncbi:transposase [Streptomyces sp. R-74717]
MKRAHAADPASDPELLAGGTFVIVVGVDAHKKTHTLVAVDPLGRRLAQVTIVVTPAGHQQACKGIGQFGQVLVAVEDCRHLPLRLEVGLLNARHCVVRVHTRLMAGARRSARGSGKSDPIDATAATRVASREPDLPKACLDGPARDAKLVADHRRLLGVRLSVGHTGQYWDNALAESFFATVKRELLGTAAWPLARPGRRPHRDLRVHREPVQPTQAAQQPRPPQSCRIRDRTLSLTTTLRVSVRAEQAQPGDDQHEDHHGGDQDDQAVHLASALLVRHIRTTA